jgi:D-alanyl-D-alanine carboxypeptidase (penicillin-binding protein 5/6)
MNRRAAELGLTETQFANACGLDAPDHHSSVRDLVRLTDAAMRLPRFAELVATRRATVATVGGERQFAVENGNALLGRLPGALGVKSGFTGKAGKCLVALAERSGVRVLLVLLNAPNRWWDAHGLIERAFAVAGAARE